MEQWMFRNLLNSWIFFFGYEKNNDLRYLNKSNNIALDMYLIALFCDEPVALLCIAYKINTTTCEVF